MKPRIDNLYVYLQQERSIMAEPFATLNQRHYPSDFRFLRGNIPDTADDVYRYALTVEINDIKRTFLIVTLESSKKKVKDFFDESLKQIEADPKLLRKFALAKRKPSNLQIEYVS